MRRVTKSGARRRGGSQKVIFQRHASPPASRGPAGAPDLALLPHGCGETIPSLRRIRASYALETNGERLYRHIGAMFDPAEFLLLERYVASGAYRSQTFAQFKQQAKRT